MTTTDTQEIQLAPIGEGSMMFALVTDQGTAMSETALCVGCYPFPANQGYAEDQALQADDFAPESGWKDTSGNDMLDCCICGKNSEGVVAPVPE